MLRFAVLASSSKANCTYVSDGSTNLLVDLGLSARETCRRLQLLGIDPASINAVLVTHEHSDHISGIPVFSKRFATSIYANPATQKELSKTFSANDIDYKLFETGRSFLIDNVKIEAFPVMHDAVDPVGFRVSSSSAAICIATDIGYVTELVKTQVLTSDAVIIETNHDVELLYDAPYPWDLKQRIKGRTGHLSNHDAGKLIEHVGGMAECQLKIIVGAHVSEKSNCPELALDSLIQAWPTEKQAPLFAVASAVESTELFELNSAVAMGVVGAAEVCPI